MAVPQWNKQTYRDGDPVPMRSYKCKSKVTQQREGAPHSTLTHDCRIGIDHDGDHKCICGKHWKPMADANAQGDN